MDVEKFVATKSQRLTDAICEKFPRIGYGGAQKLLRNKGVKVNGKRVSKQTSVSAGDEVELFVSSPLIGIAYEDENLLVAIKPRQIETCRENEKNANVQKNYKNSALKSQSEQNFVEKTLQDELERQLKMPLFAVHRLDRNTSGLIIFAKNESAEKSLLFAIKNRLIKKYYLALVKGKLDRSKKCEAYLKKDERRSLVYISDEPKLGYQKIETDYQVIKSAGDLTLVKVLLVTGKTHQIRAHFAHLGHPILGDQKYGDSTLNKQKNKRFQCLTASEIEFDFPENDALSYLSHKRVVLENDKIDFLSE